MGRAFVNKLFVILTVAVLAIAFIPAQKAYAVETSAVRTEAFAAFDDGNWAWYKLVIEKDLGNSEGRAKITVWCEPNDILGGTKIPCDAIEYTGASGVSWEVQYWNETYGWSGTNIYGHIGIGGAVQYSPPAAGYPLETSWNCSGEGDDQYRAYVSAFRAASSDQWSQWRYNKVTPTWNGFLCF